MYKYIRILYTCKSIHGERGSHMCESLVLKAAADETNLQPVLMTFRDCGMTESDIQKTTCIRPSIHT